MKTAIGAVALAAFGCCLAGEALAETWNVSLWGKRRAFTENVEKLAELVSEKTGGEFTLSLSYGGLSKNTENLDGIQIGAFEMAQICAGYHRDKNPTLTVLELPFLGVDSLEQERDLSMALYRHPAVVADLARWNATLLMPTPMPQYNFVGVGEPPRKLADFNGMTVRATGGIGEAMQIIGAVPTSMDATEVRQALDSGVVKAVSFAPHAHMSFGTIDTGTWWTTNLNPGTVNCPVVVNSDALAALSDAHREALLGSVDEALAHYIAYYNSETMARWGPALDERGIERITFAPEAMAEFRAAAAGPVAAAWIEEMSARGLPAQELYDTVTGQIGQ
ncbi:C4-dicarboxylate ABC transporter substrate-binding protein [Rhodovulum sulfidophilum]|uniref:TRAP transporter substrate-binding protein DctP n=1 Tax=Rhodovulum visakhapatnamense TaxID=364297 RepID=A0A4R8GAC6_9RHOB|nr:TRAP transporter substrate-binding protein DctP [Rhodovulum visakhapatnamense]MBL3570061.1 TRAP transporter substrate-binding protein DctP [Rhodovulum visakhapatnamense]MBL3578327.1 TRAP transporter substrate-binding protein DctP [Rhodovulum visakhapatnamense]OLS45153.1 C4-dicarboxylate ABC transporter substrate-binding protein [Rhodovulum sulfidophilum]TDX32528.1 TRAP-type C4-dicarboxylate transport system substrate-binding protein [Rhodovulum visakhapatnamense]